MKLRSLIFVSLATLWFCPCMGQFQTLKGKVLDEQGEAIPGVYIYHPASDAHVHSNILGEFELVKVEPGDSLRMSHVGFKSTGLIVRDLTTPQNFILQEDLIELGEVIISPDIKSINLFAKLDIQTNPVTSSQQILRKVPGLFIGQHAGGGKAEQIFLRGFDIDHGTDVRITVDEMPVNMVSHAHGQGYSDLHFLIPEIVDKIEFGKGPYEANKGNFATAGYVNFRTKERLSNSTVLFEAGQFNTFRAVGAFNLLNNQHHSAYLATEYLLSDGPFDSPQNFSRINLIGKYTGYLENEDEVSVLISHFNSIWDASGQIPQRAVDSGQISRFGAIDDTEGGETGRTNIKLDYTKSVDSHSYIKSTAFFSRYDFLLFSNFTFFLNDPVNGDQIRQSETRSLFGGTTEWNRFLQMGNNNGLLQVGLEFRNDQSTENELSRTLNRRTVLSSIQSGDINETNIAGYLNSEFRLGNWLINPGLRLDYFKFIYQDDLLTPFQTQSETEAKLSPKINFTYTHSPQLQLYLKSGMGFHSNDTRVVLAQNGREILPDALGADLGAIWKPHSRMLINTALWHLYLEQEFIYVGDEGIVEPSGRTRRSGIDFGLRYQLAEWVYFSSDVNYAHVRAIDEPEDNDLIPLAPELTLTAGLNIPRPSGFYGGINLRHLKDRPANEDNSIVAPGYTVVDLNAGFKWKSLDFHLKFLNLLDTEWNETQFATESRLFSEPASVTEIHFTPGTPFNVQGSIRYTF